MTINVNLTMMLLMLTGVSCQKWFNITSDNLKIPMKDGVRAKVALQIEINEIIVDAAGMMVEMGYFIHMRWYDYRFVRADSEDPNENYITLYGQDPDFEFIWVPDIYMTNEIPSGILDFAPTDYVRIYENGTVTMSKRHIVAFYCRVRLFMVPMSHETCVIHFQSNAYTVEDMDLEWFAGAEVAFSEDFVSLVSKIGSTTTTKCLGGSADSKERRPCLSLAMHIEQVYKGFVIQVYLPSSAVVVMDWLGFWLHHTEISSRVRVIQVAFTVMVTQMVGVMIVFPDTVELEPLLIWNGFCLCMIILTFIEFLVVHNIYREFILREKHNQELIVNTPSTEVQNTKGKAQDRGKVTRKKGIAQDRGKVTRIQVEPCDQEPFQSHRQPKPHQCITADRLDNICRIGYVVLCILFNIIYWSTFMHI